MIGTFLGVDSRIAYTILVGIVALQRLWEMKVSDRNVQRLMDRGAREAGARHYPVMVALHSGFLISCVAEVWLLRRPWIPAVAAASLTVLAGALALRWWALKTLGARWTTRVIVLPNEGLVTTGPYHRLRHPNYLAVVLEIAAIPMVHCAWLTALIFSIANLVLLAVRITVEERALAAAGRGRARKEIS